MEKYWIKNITYSIKCFSDIERQKKVWRGLDKNFCSSYLEDWSILFDDNDFEDFINTWEKENNDIETLSELNKFKEYLFEYNSKQPDTKKYDDIQILEDPEWTIVVQQAKKLLDCMTKKL